MLKDIVFLSVTKMKRVRADKNTIVISILDSSESVDRPRLCGFRGVLSLEFEDIAEEHHKVAVGAWPDEPTNEEHQKFASRGERLPALSDAARIVAYLQHHHASQDPVNLIVHCHGGISRSAAVAEWTSVRYWLPISLLKEQSTERANPRLLRLLNKAAGIR
jgi:predicted protein tyrosine phosphatase